MKKVLIMLSVVVILLTACDVIGPESFAQAESQSGEGNKPDFTIQSRNNVGIEKEGQKGANSSKNASHSPGTSLLNPDLTPADIEGLQFMVEEEKLARDVYIYLADTWNMNIFSNISNSEEAHMGKILTLIDRFEISDPVQQNRPGEFTNQELQELYNELIAKGSLSLADALMVGGAIEEIDILDLQEYLDITSNSAVIEVYENLLKGSINHLQAFARTYERQTGEEYQPQFLSQEEYRELIALSSESKMGQGGGMSAARQGKGRANQ